MLASAGIATVADETSTQPQFPVDGATGLVVTAWQARTMAVETESHGGILGSSLDTTLPLGDGPPLAFVIGAWASVVQDPAATAAARLLGTQDWTHADTVIFPTAVLELFVADVVTHAGEPDTPGASASAPGPDSATTPPGPSSAVAPAVLKRSPGAGRPDGFAAPGGGIVVPALGLDGAPTASCSGIASFVDGVLASVFGALKVSPNEVADWVSGTIGGTAGVVVGAVAGFLAVFWNKAVEFAEATVRSVLTALTAPVINTLRTVVGALETITTVVSYLKRWQVPLTAEPPSNSFSTTGYAAHRGSVTATIDRNGETENWPELLTDCATALGKPPPTLSTQGLPVTWSTVQQESGLVTVDRPAAPGTTGTLDANLSDRLDYTTGNEDAALAASSLVELPTITVTAQIRRTELEELSDLLIGYLSANFPAVLQPTIRSILGPIFGWAKSALDALTAVDGSATVVISHHLPDPATPTPSTAPDTPSTASTAPTVSPTDPCELVTAADASAATGVTQPAATSQDTGVTTVCEYFPQGVDYSQAVRVQVVIPDQEPTLASFQRFIGSDSLAEPVDIGAAGAYWDDTKATLYLWQDGQEVDIVVTNSWYGWTHDRSKAAAVQLATVALTRI